MFDTLFSPITINKTVVKNRIAYPSLGLLYSYDGKLNDKYYHFFAERARGGAGIVTVGPVGFDVVGSGKVILVLDDDDKIADFRKVTSIIKKEGALSWIQLFHAGAYSYSKFMGGPDPIAPSPIYSQYSKLVPREMTLDDIREAQEGFVKAALRAKEAGFDGVEIIASAGYLITQFLSPLKNKRTDRYGGSFENRVRFPREILEMMRAALGPDYPISVRMAGNDFVEGSNTSSETPAFAKVYEKAGVDLISVTGGWHEAHVPQLPMDAPRSVYSYLALNVKREVSVPVSASNRITDPFSAEQLIKDGFCDIVNLARVLIADPYWPQKGAGGRCRRDTSLRGLQPGLHGQHLQRQGGLLHRQRPGRVRGRAEHQRRPRRRRRSWSSAPGPGGLEAAVRAAEAGHRVELYEKSDRIGGQLWIAGTPPHKHELWELINYYDAMLDKYDIDVILGNEVTVDYHKRRKAGPRDRGRRARSRSSRASTASTTRRCIPPGTC